MLRAPSPPAVAGNRTGPVKAPPRHQFHGPPSKTAAASAYSLHVHELSFSSEEVIINPDVFPFIALHDVLEIIPLSYSFASSSSPSSSPSAHASSSIPSSVERVGESGSTTGGNDLGGRSEGSTSAHLMSQARNGGEGLGDTESPEEVMQGGGSRHKSDFQSSSDGPKDVLGPNTGMAPGEMIIRNNTGGLSGRRANESSSRKGFTEDKTLEGAGVGRPQTGGKEHEVTGEGIMGGIGMGPSRTDRQARASPPSTSLTSEAPTASKSVERSYKGSSSSNNIFLQVTSIPPAGKVKSGDCTGPWSSNFLVTCLGTFLWANFSLTLRAQISRPELLTIFLHSVSPFTMARSLLFSVLAALRPQVARMQISILKSVAEAFGLHAYQEVRRETKRKRWI